GIFFVELAPLSHSVEVIPLLVQLLGTAGHPDDDPVRVINERLDGQTTLIVLDNLEHLEGIERVVNDLLLGCPSARILATSRCVLQTWNQQEVELPPLDVPDMLSVKREALSVKGPDSTLNAQRSTLDLASIRRAKSVQMFTKRA